MLPIAIKLNRTKYLSILNLKTELNLRKLVFKQPQDMIEFKYYRDAIRYQNKEKK